MRIVKIKDKKIRIIKKKLKRNWEKIVEWIEEKKNDIIVKKGEMKVE